MATNNMHNLTTLIKRLEAATSRLEDMAITSAETPQANGLPVSHAVVGGTTMKPSLPSASPALSAPAASPASKADPLPEVVEDFDAFIFTHVMPYVKTSEGLGGAVAKQAEKVLAAFKAQRKFILITTKAKKPSPTDPIYMELLQPTIENMTAISEIKDKNRGKPDFNQSTAVAEGANVFAWVTVDAKPWKTTEESLQSVQFWGNKILKEFKDKDEKQVEWIKSYYNIFKELGPWIQDHFPMGMLWNSKGVAPAEAAKSVGAASGPPAPPTAGAGGPPPPPPPPPGPPPLFDITSAGPPPPPAPSGGSSSAGLGAVFADLNKGDAVTKGLRKVDKSEMTHKNPSLRASSTVPERSNSQGSITRGKSPLPPKARKPESMRTKKPPRKELDGSKWYIEHYDNESSPITIDAEIQHSILISRCAKTTIIINGKANAISIDNCSRLALVVDSLVSSVDVIKAQNLEVQVTGVLPTILMDQVDGASIYLSDESKDTEIYSSKCSGVNLNIIEGEEGDYKENALPEQIRTFVKDGKLVSEIMEHSG